MAPPFSPAAVTCDGLPAEQSCVAGAGSAPVCQSTCTERSARTANPAVSAMGPNRLVSPSCASVNISSTTTLVSAPPVTARTERVSSSGASRSAKHPDGRADGDKDRERQSHQDASAPGDLGAAQSGDGGETFGYVGGDLSSRRGRPHRDGIAAHRPFRAPLDGTRISRDRPRRRTRDIRAAVRVNSGLLGYCGRDAAGRPGRHEGGSTVVGEED